MSESESEFYGLLRHNYTVDVCFYLFTVGFWKCRIIYGRINETTVVHYDQYFASFDHKLGNTGCILLFIEAYAANQ